MRAEKKARVPGQFVPVPSWLVRSSTFKSLPDIEVKLLVYLTSRRRWEDSRVPATTIQVLAAEIGASPRRTGAALGGLAGLGAIKVLPDPRDKRLKLITLVYADPIAEAQREQENRYPLDASVERRAPSKTLSICDTRIGEFERETVPDWVRA